MFNMQTSFLSLNTFEIWTHKNSKCDIIFHMMQYLDIQPVPAEALSLTIILIAYHKPFNVV